MRNHLFKHLTLSIYAPTLLLAFCRGLLIPVLPLYASSFGVSYGLVGLVLAGQGIGTLAGDLPAGVLISKFGRKWSMLIGIGFMVLFTLALSWAQTFPELVIYTIMMGAGSSLWNVARHAYLTDATPIDRRGRAIAIFGGINRVGTFAGPVVGGWVGATYGLRLPFVLYAVVAAAALTFPLFFVRRLGRPHVSRGGLRGHSGHLWTILREHRRTFLTAGTGQVFGQMIRSGRTIIVPLYAADVLGLDVQAIGWIVSLSSAIDMSLFYVAGFLMDRFGRKYAYVPCFSIQAVGMALIPFTGDFTSLLLATLVIGFGNGLGSGTMMTLGADLAPEDSMGEFLGIWRLIGDSGQTGGPIVVGSVADLLTLSAGAFVIAGVGMAAAAILGLLVPETLDKQTRLEEVETPAD